MGKMLDLSAFKKETLDITLLDGRLIKVAKPTEAMVIKMLSFRELKEDGETVLGALNDIVLDILNTNVNGIKLDAKYVANDLDLEMKMAVIYAYTDFIHTITSNPN